jgi:hypothetical protein
METQNIKIYVCNKNSSKRKVPGKSVHTSKKMISGWQSGSNGKTPAYQA